MRQLPDDDPYDDDDLGDDDQRLTDTIVRRIENATSGHVSGLYVARLGDAIVVHGYCRTYHARELAHKAALDLAEGSAPVIDLLTVV
jgi:hypothetical protein